jgi:hypothetical protein
MAEAGTNALRAVPRYRARDQAMIGKPLGRSNPIHKLGIAGRAVGMCESAGGGICIVGLPIDLFGDPIFLPRRPVLIPDQSANAADGKDEALVIDRHGVLLRLIVLAYSRLKEFVPRDVPSFPQGFPP